MARLRLQIEGPRHVGHHRPAGDVQAGRCVHQERGTSQRGQPHRAYAGGPGDLVGPRPGGVHHRTGGHVPGVRADPPASPLPAERPDPGEPAERAPGRADAPQVALVQRVHVDVPGGGLQHRAAEPVPPHDRADARHVGDVDLPGGWVDLGPVAQLRVEEVLVAGRAEGQRAPWGEQRVGGEPRGWVGQRVAAGPGQGADRRAAVVLGEQGGGAAGGVVPGHLLHLGQQHAAVPGEVVAGGGARDATADDHIVNRHWIGRWSGAWPRATPPPCVAAVATREDRVATDTSGGSGLGRWVRGRSRAAGSGCRWARR